MLDSGRNPAWLADCGRRADNTARPLGNLSKDALLVIKVAQLDGVLAARCACLSVRRLKTACCPLGPPIRSTAFAETSRSQTARE